MDITTLEYGRNLINDMKQNGKGINTFHTDVHLVVITIGKPICHRSPSHNAPLVIKQESLQQEQNAQGNKQPSPNEEHRGNKAAQTCDKDQDC